MKIAHQTATHLFGRFYVFFQLRVGTQIKWPRATPPTRPQSEKPLWVGPVLPLILSSDTVVLEGDLRSIVSSLCIYFFSYCAFHKHANSKVQKMPSQLRFSLPSIIIMITSTEPCNTQNGSKSTNHRSQTMTFWTCLSKVLFPNRSAKMIDGSEKGKRQLAFELESSRFFFEKRSNA